LGKISKTEIREQSRPGKEGSFLSHRKCYPGRTVRSLKRGQRRWAERSFEEATGTLHLSLLLARRIDKAILLKYREVDTAIVSGRT